ncbi:hypothetical protein [Planktothrix pseudagardhii]|uniref:Uncharacterized protein n=1 Tax=Planktothrix pseudagardhii TaxID=132604 RepID=A0A9W4CUA9_9CYAN|nr:hypothetical protein [Planktothrix pseudagardhii]CAD5988571.1 hypothetical protein NO713_05739 [Planktothrix pseudagardhii]
MQTINISPTTSTLDDNKPPKLILLKGIAIATITVSLIGGIVHVVNSRQAMTKANPEDVIYPGSGRRKLTTPIQPSEPPLVVTKKPQKPIEIEEGSEAWFCIKNNGGSSCVDRSRTAPNYRVVQQQKNYEDYLVQYDIRPINNCPPEISWQPNCQH